MLGLREIVVGISLRMHRFDPRLVHVRIGVDKAAQGQGFLQVLRLLLSISSHKSCILYMVILSSRTNGRSLETFQNAMLFPKSRLMDRTALSEIETHGQNSTFI